MDIISMSMAEVLRANSSTTWSGKKFHSRRMLLSDIPDRLKLLRRSQADLARHLELDPSSLTKTLKGERRVQPAERVRIEAYFGEKLDLEVTATAPGASRRRPVPQKIPVYGYAALGSDEAVAYAEDRVLDYLDPPPFWNGAGNVIYIRIIGESMYPRYFSGEIVPIRLDLPPARGQDCLVELADDTALVKTYQGQRDGQVWVQQYGDDPRTYGIEATRVRKLHAVWKPGMV